MKNASFSQNVQALALIDTYNVIINERKRIRQNTNFQITSKKLIQQSNKIRRKSCHCQLCGDISIFQFDMMNIPFQKNQQQVENVQLKIQDAPILSLQRPSIFFRIQSLKSSENDKLRLSLKIHGCDKNFNRQSTLQQLIAKNNDRSRKGSVNASGFINTSTSENHSVNSLNIKTCIEQSPILIQSPLSSTITSRKTITSPKKLQMMSTYFSQSARSLKTTQFQQIGKSKALILPKLIQKRQNV